MRHLAGLCLMWMATSAFAAPSADHWIEVKSPHFIVLTNASEKSARHIAGQFERMQAVFRSMAPTSTIDAGPPIVVLALKDKKAMQALEPAAYLAKNSLELTGLFLREPDKNYILVRLDTQDEHAFSTVYHEYTHYMLRKSDGWLPLWLNEGLAEFYQNTDIADTEVKLGQPSLDDLTYLEQQRLLPLTTLLKVDHASPYYHDEQKGSIFYAESWALTHYLVISDRENGTHRVREYTQLMSKHGDAVTAAQQAFGDLDQLQKTLQAYVHQQTFKYFKMPTGFSADEASFPLRLVPGAEVDAIRADVLVDTGRMGEASALLQWVLQEDSRSALAHEVMGELAFRQGDLKAAKKWYQEAVSLDSHSALAHYYYAVFSLEDDGRVSQEAGAGQGEIEANLRTAIKLNPNFAPAYDALAVFCASHHEGLNEAQMLSLHAVEMEPENLGYRLNSAQIMAELERFSDALRVLHAAAPLARKPEETEAVQTRIKEVEAFQAAKDVRERSADRAEKDASPASGEATTLPPGSEILTK